MRGGNTVNIDYQLFLDQIEQALSDYTTMAQEETQDNRQSYYNGICQGLREASDILAEIIDGNLTV